MRFSRWGIFFAIPLIKMQLEAYDQVRAELKALDNQQLMTMAPLTASWVEGWKQIYDAVKK